MRTLQEIRECGKEFLVPTDVAGFLHCSAYSINLAVRDNPKALGFRQLPQPLQAGGVRILQIQLDLGKSLQLFRSHSQAYSC